MSYKFNTDKLNIMKSIESLVKTLITAFIFIFFLTSLIQTASFFQLTVKGSYDITGTDGGQTSGIVYLTTLGKNDEGVGYGSEDNWSEISSSNNNAVEEMEEGSFHCELSLMNRNCWHKYPWEGNDEWESRMAVHKTKITNLAKIGHTDVFEPSSINHNQDNFYMGFKLNAELSSSEGSKFKEHMERNSRGGFGLFLIAVPYTGHFIQKIEIANIGDRSGNFIEFKSPNSNPNCTNTSCQLDFDNDFTHKNCHSGNYQQGWINYGRNHYCFSLSRESDSHVSQNVKTIPQTQRGTIFENHYMPAYSISENSIFRGKECVGCLDYGSSGDKKNTNLWNKVWDKMSEFQPELVNALKASAIRNPAHKAQARTLISDGDPIFPSPKMNSDNTLPDTYLRREQPVVIGLMADYDGGDLWFYDVNHGTYLDVYSVSSYEYQIRVLFAENGYNIDAEIWKPTLISETNTTGNTTASEHVASVMSWNQTPKTLNSDVPNLGEFDTSIITMGQGGSEDCIYRATFTKWKTVKGDKIYYDDANSTSNIPIKFDVIGGTADTEFLPLGATVQTGGFEGYNYDFVVQTFPPNFYVKSQDLGAYGTISQGHVLANGWELNENNRTPIAQNKFGSVPNEIATCGFIDSYQQVNIAPKKKDFYYFHDITSVNADIYVRDIMSGSNSMKYEKLTSANITYIKYGLNPFYVYAQIKPEGLTPTTDPLLKYAIDQKVAEVNITFKKFPTIELKSVIGSNLVARVTPNRVQTTTDRISDSTHVDYCKKNLIFSDKFPLYSVQPQSPATTNDCASVEFTINKKLERIYIQMTDQGLITPIQIFSNESTEKAKEGISPDPGNEISILPLPSSTTPNQTNLTTALSDQGRHLTLEKLSGPEEYKLTLPAVGQNIEVYIDFVPFALYYYAATDNANASGTIIPKTESKLSGFIDLDSSASEIISDEMDLQGNGTATVKATNGEVKNTNVNIREDGRLTYYISDILEERKPDVGPTEITSRWGDYFSKLSASLFGGLLKPDFFSTRPVDADTNIFFILSEYKNIELKFLDTSENLGQVTMWMDGLVAPYNNDGVTSISLTSHGTKNDPYRFESNGNYTQFKPNKIRYENPSPGPQLIDGYVGFRMRDTPTITVQPNAGYYIKEATVEAENQDGTWSQIMEVINLPETPDALGARDITIDEVTKNIRITIDFEEKPSIKSYWLGTDF